MDLGIAGRKAIVCASSRGLGRACAKALAEAGCEVVINGRQNVTTSASNVMPAFGTTEDVVSYLDDIYGYLKARSDGALGRGRPKRAGDD